MSFVERLSLSQRVRGSLIGDFTVLVSLPSHHDTRGDRKCGNRQTDRQMKHCDPYCTCMAKLTTILHTSGTVPVSLVSLYKVISFRPERGWRRRKERGNMATTISSSD